jgi:hypothetical protein
VSSSLTGGGHDTLDNPFRQLPEAENSRVCAESTR